MLQACAACGAFAYPPRDACPQCLSADLAFREAADGGTLVTATTVHVPIGLWFRERAPWRTGLVRLDAGPTMVAHLHGDCTEGGRVRMRLMLDPAGQPAAFALPATDTPNMADDPQFREFTAAPKFRRVLVTDGRSATGAAVARALSAAGAATVFVGVRDRWQPFPDEEALTALPGVQLVSLDPNDERSVARLVADIGGKTDILVNTAEHVRPGGLTGGRLTEFRDALESDALGLARLAAAFGPAMRGRGADGTNNAVAWVNCLSVFALVNWPAYGAWSAAQAAALSVAECLRAELRPGGVRVVNVFSGPLDTAWFQAVPPPKLAPSVLAAAVVDALERGLEDVYVGDVARDIHDRLARNPKAVERELAE
jgi:NAD(P)-dependent dehydrogenase (short-subunit alcohol dehydrogenase family)